MSAARYLPRRSEKIERETIMASIQVPTTFLCSPFYETGTVVPLQEEITTMLDCYPFYAEMISFVKEDIEKPWLHKEKWVPILLNKWKESQDFLEECYRQRHRQQARQKMVLSMAMLIEVVYWINKTPVSNVMSYEQLSIKPMNVEERIPYMLRAPDHYLSFVQLKSLFEESEKLFYKAVAMEQRE